MSRVVKKKLAESVLEEIRSWIEAGSLKEGDKLPNQNELAAELGVSRPSLREAMKILEDIGAIEQRPGFGTVFRGRSPILYASHLVPPLFNDAEAVIEVIEARKFIELGCMELACDKATDEQIEDLGRVVDGMEQMLDEGRMAKYTEHDITFHYKIAKASQNRFMLHQFVTNRRLLEHIIEDGFKLIPGMHERSRIYHRAIFEALTKRHRDQALRNMANHINDVLISYIAHQESAKAKERVEAKTK